MGTHCIIDRKNGLIHGNDNRISIAGRFSGHHQTFESLSLFSSFAMSSLSFTGQYVQASDLCGLLSEGPSLLIGAVRHGELSVRFSHGDNRFGAADILVLPLDSEITLTGSDCTLDCLIFGEPQATVLSSVVTAKAFGHLLAGDVCTNLFYQQFTSFRAYAHLMQQDEAEDLVQPLVMTLATILKRQTPSAPDKQRDQLGKLQAYIEKNLLEADLSPTMIADQLGLSRASLYRLAEPFGGVQKYIRSMRLKRAYAHLASGDDKARSITNLAYELGFTTETAFRRSFKESFGLTPTEVRRQAS